MAVNLKDSRKVHKLNFPSFNYQLQKKNGQMYIFDVCRKKYIRLSPEEWVRQHLVHYLISLGYPPGLMRIEGGLDYHSRSKRSDVMVLSRTGSVFLLAECKAPSVCLNQQCIEQLFTYNHIYKSEYLLLSNGIRHYNFRRALSTSNSLYQPTEATPFYETDGTTIEK